ncbi:MAG: hypothetical protein MUP03_09565, partial [Anaerolineales bacterium]|nr:hypothetical protein [Anaerolineales bacterium]
GDEVMPRIEFHEFKVMQKGRNRWGDTFIKFDEGHGTDYFTFEPREVQRFSDDLRRVRRGSRVKIGIDVDTGQYTSIGL